VLCCLELGDVSVMCKQWLHRPVVSRQHDRQPAIASLPLETSDVQPLYYRLHNTESTMKRPSLLFRHNCYWRMTVI